MEKLGFKNVKSNRGITLIALIITIVVMLILAGVTINLTLGENGIFTTAQQAAKNYTDAQNKEMADLGNFSNLVNDTINGLGEGKLSDIITAKDYGKYINYSVTVEGTTLNNWRVFYNDKTTNNVYIIYDGYLPNTLIPKEIGIKTTGKYQLYWSTDDFSTNEQVVETLTNTDNWKEFAKGVEGAIATGGPTYEMLANSWNTNPTVNSTLLTPETDASELVDLSKLYIPYTEANENCLGYWLNSTTDGYPNVIWYVRYSGHIGNRDFSKQDCGIRPLVCLPSGIAGTVGTSVNMDN